jgi:hypothetical protein
MNPELSEYSIARDQWNQQFRCLFSGFNQCECAQEIEGPSYSRCHATCWMFTSDKFPVVEKIEPSFADFYR